jgi:hypothetical protein
MSDTPTVVCPWCGGVLAPGILYAGPAPRWVGDPQPPFLEKWVGGAGDLLVEGWGKWSFHGHRCLHCRKIVFDY